MPLSLYSLSVPVFIRLLGNLARLLENAERQARARGLDPTVLLDARLYPDMLPFVRQVQILTDGIRGAVTRLAGIDPQPADDPDHAVFNRGENAVFRPAERDFAALAGRVESVLERLRGIGPEQFDGAETRRIAVVMGEQRRCFDATPFLLHYVLPNVYFHLSIAYAILRHNGIELGKADYEGEPVYALERVVQA